MSRKHDSARRARVLSFENLENRELLTVSPLLTTAAAIEPNAIRDAWIAGSNYTELPGPIDFSLPEEGENLEISNGVIQNVGLKGYTLTFADVNSNGALLDNLFGVESVVFTGAEQCTITCDGKDYAGEYSYLNNGSLHFEPCVSLPLSFPKDFSYNAVPDSLNFHLSVRALGDPPSFYPGGQVDGFVSFLDSTSGQRSVVPFSVNVSGTRTLEQPQISEVFADASSIDVRWNQVDGADGYKISVRKSGSTTERYVLASRWDFGATLYDLDPSTTYEVKVVALGNGESTLNSAASAYTTVKTRAFITLEQPTVTVVATDKRSIDITWNEVPNGDLYEVSCCDSKTGYTISDVVDVRTRKTPWQPAQYSFSNLTPGTSYKVKVVAVGDDLYTKTSKATSYKTVKTDSLVTLAQPTITTITSDARDVSVAWEPVAGAQGYVAICNSSTTNEDFRFDLSSGETSCRFVNLTPGTSYKVKVVAKGDGIDTSDSKDTAYKTIKTKSLPTLATPTITSLTSDKRTIDVAWKTVPNATGYHVSYRPSNSTETAWIYVSASSGVTSHTISNLTPGTSYTVAVVAEGDRETADSKESTKKISTKSLPALAQPTITSVTSDERAISLEWERVADAQGYVAICSSSTTKEDFRVDLASDETSYRFVNLTPNTSYKVKVVAKGNGIDSADSKDAASKTVKTKQLATLATPTITQISSDKRSIEVAWKFVSNATGYYVSYRSSNLAEGDMINVPADETSYSFSNLTPGTSYTISVYAYGDWYNTAESKASTKKISTKSLVTLAQPTITSLTSDKRSIDVAWKAVKSASGYQVSYAYSTANTNSRIYKYVDSETTSFAFDSLTPGTSYAVRVVALGDGLGTQNSKDASYKKITTKSLETLATPTITSLTSDKRSIAVAWNAVNGASGYTIGYTTASGDDVSVWVRADQTSYTFSNLAPGTAHTVKVFARGDYVDTANSKEATKKISTKSLVTLTQPTIKADNIGSRSISISWNAVNAVEYVVSYREKNSSETAYVNLPADVTTFNLNNAAPNTSYVFKVVAKGDGIDTLDSKDTASKTITTKPLTTLAKPAITSCQTSDSAILVNWKPVDGADLIAVEYKKAGTNDDWQVKYVDGDETHCVLEDLDAGAKYSVRAKAFGDRHWTLDSQYSTTTTATLAKSPKLLAPEIIGIDPSAVTATLEIECRENAAAYEVAYRKSGSTSWTKLVFDAYDEMTGRYCSKLRLEGLKPNQSYGVKMRAIGPDGLADSDYCQETTFKTAVQTKLESPAKLEFQTLAQESITLSWKPVENAVVYVGEFVHPGGESLIFTVSYTHRTFSNLDPGTNYKFRIRAIGDGDYFVESEFSNFLEVKTDYLNDGDLEDQSAPDD